MPVGFHMSWTRIGYKLIYSARSPDSKDPGRIQILHYNLERFPNEITDMRGLETLLVTT